MRNPVNRKGAVMNGDDEPGKKSPTPQDREFGRRLRLRRVELHMSQQDVANHIGVSFQQIQKYERGINRIGAGRLKQIAAFLQCGTDYFFASPKDKTHKEVESLLFIDASLSLRLLRAYHAIGNQELKRRFVILLEGVQVAEEEAA